MFPLTSVHIFLPKDRLVTPCCEEGENTSIWRLEDQRYVNHLINYYSWIAIIAIVIIYLDRHIYNCTVDNKSPVPKVTFWVQFY